MVAGMPWALIRESARPEDVCQGAIGNCWFAGALSVVAAQDWLISKMFITKHFNRWGAYQIQLHHSGEWKGVLIDDLLPTAKIFEGFADGNMIHYSRGGMLSLRAAVSLSADRHFLVCCLLSAALRSPSLHRFTPLCGAECAVRC